MYVEAPTDATKAKAKCRMDHMFCSALMRRSTEYLRGYLGTSRREHLAQRDV